MKNCRTCEESKPHNSDFFHLNRKAKSGLSNECKECAKKRVIAWSVENKSRKAEADKEYARKNKEKISQYQKDYRSKNKEKSAEYSAMYRERNAESLSIKRKEYFSSARVKEARSKYSLKRKAYDSKYRITAAVRSSVSGALKNQSGALRHVGWSVSELMKHLERQFLKGMSWDNYGEWHIDHITPCKSFNYTSANDDGFRQCWSLSNLRPLWAKDNCSKQAKITNLI